MVCIIQYLHDESINIFSSAPLSFFFLFVTSLLLFSSCPLSLLLLQVIIVISFKKYVESILGHLKYHIISSLILHPFFLHHFLVLMNILYNKSTIFTLFKSQAQKFCLLSWVIFTYLNFWSKILPQVVSYIGLFQFARCLYIALLYDTQWLCNTDNIVQSKSWNSLIFYIFSSLSVYSFSSHFYHYFTVDISKLFLYVYMVAYA